MESFEEIYGSKEKFYESIRLWKNNKRISLSTLLNSGNASVLHSWRSFINILNENYDARSINGHVVMKSNDIIEKNIHVLEAITKMKSILDFEVNKLSTMLKNSLVDILDDDKCISTLSHVIFLTLLFCVLCSPECLAFGDNFRLRLYGVLSSVFVNLKLPLPSELVKNEILYIFSEFLPSIISNDCSNKLTESLFHNMSLIIIYLCESGSLPAVKLCLLSAIEILSIVKSEFHPRFLLIYSKLFEFYLKHAAPPSSSLLTDLEDSTSKLFSCEKQQSMIDKGKEIISEVLMILNKNYLLAQTQRSEEIGSNLNLTAFLESLSQVINKSLILY